MGVWQYCCDVYVLDGVADACLSLQEQGWNVPLLLFVGWYGAHKGVMSDEQLSHAHAFSERYSSMCVLPIRQMRQAMKLEPLIHSDEWRQHREQVKRWELAAEEFQLRQLEQLLGGDFVGSVDICAITNNLECLGSYYSPLSHQELEQWQLWFSGPLQWRG